MREILLIFLAVAIAAVVTALVLYYFYSPKGGGISVVYLGAPLNELPWKGEGTRSYMLNYIPVKCGDYCALVKAWVFSLDSCPPEEDIEVIARFCCGAATGTLTGQYYKEKFNCYLGSFLISAKRPIVLRWRGIEVLVTGSPEATLHHRGEVIAVVFKRVPASLEGWSEYSLASGVKVYVKEESTAPYTALVVIKADREVTLELRYGSTTLEVTPHLAPSKEGYISGIVLINALGKIEINVKG